MRSRLFHAVVAGGLALAAPLTLPACSSDGSHEPGTDAGVGSADQADRGADGTAAPGEAGVAPDAGTDGGWPPTK